MAERGVARQFDDSGQKHAAATLGMWIFLAGEILFFGGMFIGYTVYRIRYPNAFHVGSEHLYLWIAVANTAILLTSSLFVALAHHAAGTNDSHKSQRLLSWTIALGLAFLVLKGLEYYLDYQERIVPVLAFDESAIEGAEASRVQLFLIFYFIMTGIHAVHVTVGVAVWIVLVLMIRRARSVVGYRNIVEMAGLYWHFVDIVWLFLLPLLYLLGAS